MDTTIIQAVADAGFDVYMRNERDTYLFFTDGTNIGYLQQSSASGLSLSTVHKPSHTHGTGYRITDHLQQINAEALRPAFMLHPAWAPSVSLEAIRKWSSMDEYRAANSFNAGLSLVASAHREA
jgi:hypothetical protein